MMILGDFEELKKIIYTHDIYEIELEFGKYYIESEQPEMPDKSGLYAVYAYDVRYPNEIRITTKKPIYIGQSKDIKGRLSNHEKYPRWIKYCGEHEALCYTSCRVIEPDKSCAENALVYHIQPPINDKLTKSFDHPDTRIVLVGDNIPIGIPEEFVVYRF